MTFEHGNLITSINVFSKLILFKPSYQLGFLLAIFYLNVSVKIRSARDAYHHPSLMNNSDMWPRQTSIVGEIKHETLNASGQKQARCDLHYWKWIWQTTKSANWAPASRLNKRQKWMNVSNSENSETMLKCKTNRWELVFLTWNFVCQDYNFVYHEFRSGQAL